MLYYTDCEVNALRKSNLQISYKKLWIRLAERDMKRTDLIVLSEISPATLAKLGKNEPVNMMVLLRMCEVLAVNVGDIVDFIPSESETVK